MKPNKGQFDTGSLQKMGKALGWDRESGHAVKYESMPERGIHNEIVDAVENVGESKVKVKPKFPSAAKLAEKYRK